MSRLRVLVLAALALLSMSATASARSSTPPTGRTMAPTETNCASITCHSGPGPAGVTISLLDGATPFTQYTPGQSYRLTLGMGSTGIGRRRWGFEMTCLTTTGGTRAGDFATADALTITQMTATKEYISHFSAVPTPPDGTFRTNPGPVSWQMDWTAPAIGPGAVNVTFYVCGNAADNSGTTTGDAISCTTFPVTVGLPPADTDGDTLLDSAETGTCTSPTDADTDDDGVSDGDEIRAAAPTNPCNCDSDRDSLPDGLELGVRAPLPDTSLATGCFIADTDPTTTTNPNSADSDGDSPDAVQCLDGVEDTNRDGAVTPPETDPNDPLDCPAPTGLDVRIDARVTSLITGRAATCGLKTNPPIANWLLTACDSPRTIGCDPAPVVPPTRVVTINPGQPGPDLTLLGEADAAFEAGPLTYYEIDGCSVMLLMSRSGADLLLDTP